MIRYNFLTQALRAARWLCITVFAAFAIFLFPGSGTAQDADHPMQKQGYFVASENLYVPPKPDRVPALTPGQQFICVPDPQQPLAYQDAASGTLLPRSDVALKVLTMIRVDSSSKIPALLFSVEGNGRSILLSTSEEDVTKLPGLQPLVEDDTLRRLRNKYVGTRVWVNGNGSFQVTGLTKQPNTEAYYALDSSQTVRIKRLFRIYTKQSFMALNSGGGINDRGGVSATNTLIAVLDLPKGFHWRGSAFNTEGLHPPPNFAAQAQASPHSVCLGFFSNHVDDWDFERTFSLVNLAHVHSRWPHELRVGMTPDMVAWVRGWPPEYGTMAQLRKEGKWQYPTMGPFSYWVYFKNGKVINFGADGRLP